MPPYLALKIDVDTWRGTREGVPRLMTLLQRHGAKATFLFSLGPDHTGRAIKRVWRKGFMRKVTRTSVLAHYGWRTLLYGTLLPGPDIGQREAALMRSVAGAGFEVGIHTWDHIKWQDHVATQGAAWTRQEMQKAVERFIDIFGTAPRTHGAAGWQMNAAAYAIEKELQFDYASDCRGKTPFLPVDEQGIPCGVPQLPTTLPTLDELIGLNGVTAANVHDTLLALTQSVSGHHVYTLHAELEGLRLLEPFEKLLIAWREQGYELVSCATLFQAVNTRPLPRCLVGLGSIAGRSGLLAIQKTE